ncbi:hypothetical protein HC891_24145 [Candidatus Gracilibacteria bacterium]|nr:hypothetical protein [Candidatus Gracilibacteria bacterium]
MNIALIALPRQGKPVPPPLTLAYIATLLDQRRHIVRLYDLELSPDTPLTAALQPLRIFRPQLVIVASETAEAAAEVAALLEEEQRLVLPITLHMDDLYVGCTCAEVLRWLDSAHPIELSIPSNNDARSSVPGAAVRFEQLPFPARHLLPLERYNLRAIGGELQTTLLIGQIDARLNGKVELRAPAHIVEEMRNVSYEFGFRHYLLPHIPLTLDLQWLHELLTRLSDARLNVGWQGIVHIEHLDEPLIERMARAGAEMLVFDLSAASVFDSLAARSRIKDVVMTIRRHGIYTRANVRLEAPYETVMNLVDVSATFGLDDVVFSSAAAPQYEAIAQQVYDMSRDRQRLIDRYGSMVGSLLWRLRGSRDVFNDETEAV